MKFPHSLTLGHPNLHALNTCWPFHPYLAWSPYVQPNNTFRIVVICNRLLAYITVFCYVMLNTNFTGGALLAGSNPVYLIVLAVKLEDSTTKSQEHMLNNVKSGTQSLRNLKIP